MEHRGWAPRVRRDGRFAYDVAEIPDREIALEFLERFAAERFDHAASLMANGLQFRGPSGRNVFGVQAQGGEARVQRCWHKVINVIEDEEGITVLCEYDGAVALMITQWFRFQNHRIVETELIYEPKEDHRDWSTILLRGVRCALRRPGHAEANVPRRRAEPSEMDTLPLTRTREHAALD